jgi:hypothetical protein
MHDVVAPTRGESGVGLLPTRPRSNASFPNFMAKPDEPNSSSPGSLPGGPPCPRCGQPMRLVSSEPHHRYINIEARDYACDCGENAGHIVASET